MKDFIEKQVNMLKNDFSTDQIKRNVYEYFFKNYMPSMPMETLISRCMDVYAEIIKRSEIKPESAIRGFLCEKSEQHGIELHKLVVGIQYGTISVQSYDEGRNTTWETHEEIEL